MFLVDMNVADVQVRMLRESSIPVSALLCAVKEAREYGIKDCVAGKS